MQSTHDDTLADISFSLNWEKNGIKYEDSYFASEANLWQDFFPDGIRQEIINRPEGYHDKKRGFYPAACCRIMMKSG